MTARQEAEKIVAVHIRGKRPIESHAEMVDAIEAAILAENIECAKLIEQNVIMDTMDTLEGKVLRPRPNGDVNSLFYASAIRSRHARAGEA